MLHIMKLKESPFERIKNGSKTIEFRLYDEKRRKVKVGDKIEFSKLPDLQEKILVEVLDIYKDESFENLFKKIYSDKEEIEKKTKLMYQFYSPKQEKEYGVVGIKIALLSNGFSCAYDNLIIRDVKYEDIEQIVDINIKDWKKVYKGIIDDEILNNLNREEKIKKWRKHYNISNVIVAEENGTILGYCRYDDNAIYENTDIDSEIIAIYVDCDKLGKGIGRKLIEYVKKDLKNKNKTKMVIWCLEKNQNARKFYEKMGGNLLSDEKYFEKEGKKYKEVGYVYNIKTNE